jgi:glycosyltransferase involved in cell wall biosynthesis
VKEAKKDISARKTILIYSQSDLAMDPRVHRQIELLAEHFDLVAFGKNESSVKVKKIVDLTPLLSLYKRPSKGMNRAPLKITGTILANEGFVVFLKIAIKNIFKKAEVFPFLLEFWDSRVVRNRIYHRLRATECDLIIANDSTALSICARAKGNRPLLFDAHEYTPGQYPAIRKHRRQRIYSRYLLRKYLPECDAISTVGEGIAKIYKRMFGVNTEIVTNAPTWQNLFPRYRKDGKIKLVHHGIATKKRDLEKMVDVMNLLDERFTLDFFLMAPNQGYYEELRRYAAPNPRIFFNEPVPMTKLPEVLNDFDVGFWLYNPSTINLANALPNKFFEFVQARLAVVIGPVPEMAEYIERYGFGLVSKDFSPESMAQMLSSLDEKRLSEFKQKAHECSRDLSSEPNKAKMLKMVESLILK